MINKAIHTNTHLHTRIKITRNVHRLKSLYGVLNVKWILIVFFFKRDNIREKVIESIYFIFYYMALYCCAHLPVLLPSDIFSALLLRLRATCGSSHICNIITKLF